MEKGFEDLFCLFATLEDLAPVTPRCGSIAATIRG